MIGRWRAAPRTIRVVRWGALAAVLLALAPLISLFAAGAIAQHYGCTLHEGFANPCVIRGHDYGGTLYNMAVMGWAAMLTLPFGALALAAWVVVEIARAVMLRRAG